MANTVVRPAEAAVPVLREADVVVIGGGPAGSAQRSARPGRERGRSCRAYGSSAAWLPPAASTRSCPNHVAGERLDTGVFAAWCDAMARLGGMLSDGRTFNPEVAKLAAEQLCLEAGVDLLYHASFDLPLMDGGRIDAATFHRKSGTVAVRGKVYVDATGDADLAARAGATIEVGRDEDHLTQPMTANFDMGGVDPERMGDRQAINELYEAARRPGG